MPDWVIPTLTIIIGPGGLLTGYWLYRREAKKAPVDRQDAQVAQAIAISTTANAMYQTVTTRLTAQDTKVDQLEAKNDLFEGRLNRWGAWYVGLASGWPVHRLQEVAPAPPE